MPNYNFDFQPGEGLKVTLEKDQREEARIENLEYQQEHEQESEAWDMRESDYL